jgi:hypothetical protein
VETFFWSLALLRREVTSTVQPRHNLLQTAHPTIQNMPEKRKTESELEYGDSFPAKRARQQVLYDDLDESTNSNPPIATRSNNVEENEIDASEHEDGEANLNNKRNNTTINKQNAQQRHHQHPRVDPVYGQRSAFPGLDDEGSDELLYGPPEDGLEYLRLVR